VSWIKLQNWIGVLDTLESRSDGKKGSKPGLEVGNTSRLGMEGDTKRASDTKGVSMFE